jgi:hypothetical protein
MKNRKQRLKIGATVIGFKFENNTCGLAYTDSMVSFEGEVGVITDYRKDKHVYSVQFSNGTTWRYPAHLVEEFVELSPTEGIPSYTKDEVLELLDNYRIYSQSNGLGILALIQYIESSLK